MQIICGGRSVRCVLLIQRVSTVVFYNQVARWCFSTESKLIHDTDFGSVVSLSFVTVLRRTKNEDKSCLSAETGAAHLHVEAAEATGGRCFSCLETL